MNIVEYENKEMLNERRDIRQKEFPDFLLMNDIQKS